MFVCFVLDKIKIKNKKNKLHIFTFSGYGKDVIDCLQLVEAQ